MSVSGGKKIYLILILIQNLKKTLSVVLGPIGLYLICLITDTRVNMHRNNKLSRDLADTILKKLIPQPLQLKISSLILTNVFY
jgi:hypothetical protein